MEEVKANKCSCTHTGVFWYPVMSDVACLILLSKTFNLPIVGKKVQVLSGHKDWISCCSVSSDCSMIASVGRFDRVSYVTVDNVDLFSWQSQILQHRNTNICIYC